ncbi:RidA family protein [Cyclobacterium marinum]|uniref:Endoribonuclease L-PSP n=1 Tax=Cyclobacterium marinum (strain ATCC 25205 / DSM 745 / LMG 13164 / NCIMB 1802) TaxID=880070 RepID=G0IUV9_CYCMS|nr:Rid family hydrolase [Cyclobacterium marinum]AEL26183.1 Endoribonuclease L-PSP [Cyclobacterium marinum DSM 745]MBI0399541.1 RidA family protein [Cyclobacterium marinum]MBR9776768.1 RidA family protein [Cytophagales bacterium]|tara:strand:+ start:49131 stop:49511 length:381 start_codon:yes stop_codon:yes gene_type:complete
MVKKEIVSGEGVPQSALPFSPALKVNDLVFVSGQASVDENGKIVNDTFEGEVRRSFENARKILAAAGLDFSDVVQVRNYVANQDDLAEFNVIYKDYFQEPYPARTTLIGCLGTLLKFEVDLLAHAR